MPVKWNVKRSACTLLVAANSSASVNSFLLFGKSRMGLSLAAFLLLLRGMKTLLQVTFLAGVVVIFRVNRYTFRQLI